ncbi:MAG: CRISPR-associated endonuclease Cas2 [Candidatus Paceibacterota bacterium]|jgi:hypothetical protein
MAIKYTYKGAPEIILTLLDQSKDWDTREFLTMAVNELQPLIVRKKYTAKHYASLSVERLCSQGLVIKTVRGKKEFYMITKMGERKLRDTQRKKIKITKTVWDGKWRMVIFDIKETKRKKRNLLRRELKAQGFERLQQSVWIYPYECYDYVALLKTSFASNAEILYAIVEKLENDEWLLKKFGLKGK